MNYACILGKKFSQYAIASSDVVATGDRPCPRKFGVAGEFEVLVERSDQIRLDGGKTGHGFTVTFVQKTSEKGSSRTTVFYGLTSGKLVGTFAIRQKADFVTKDGVLTFADIARVDGTKLPVTIEVQPANRRPASR